MVSNTVVLASLPSVVAIWDAVHDGAEVNPPGYQILAHLSQSIFGAGHLALRLPAIVAYWLFSLSLFAFARPRAGTLLAACAMLLPSLTVAQYYSTEARGYSIVLLSSVASLLFWRMTYEGSHRRLGLCGLALSLMAATGCHYYGVLLIGVVAAGELTRSLWGTKRVDYPVWISLGAAGLFVVALLPLINVARSYADQFWSAPAAWSRLPEIYSSLLEGAIPALLAAALLATPHLFFPGTSGNRDNRRPHGPPLHELIAVVCMIALPVVAFILAKTVTNALHYRYVLFPIAGVSILLAWLGSALPRKRGILGSCALLAILCGFTLSQFKLLRIATAEQVMPLENIGFDTLASQPNLPVVFSDYPAFLPATFYLSPEKSSRFYLLVEQKGNTTSRLMLSLSRRSPINVEELPAFIAVHRRFLLYGPGGGIFEALRSDGAIFDLKSNQGPVYEVTLSPQSPQAP
ncbi:MAG: glycosyltransferase family 39 protein [Acidobacteria bacterium]|nr:glycosyltransferase family 39 protein [Acidobacteriota bacterium]